MRFLRKFVRIFTNKKEGLTRREKNMIFRIAARNGCDWDGDILRIYVDESKDNVHVLKP